MKTLTLTIPGKPCAQGRPRGFKTPGGHVRMYDPKTSRDWKGSAKYLMMQAADESGWNAGDEVTRRAMPNGPIGVSILATFPCPKTDHRKSSPRPRRWHTKRGGDADNIAKAVLDAGSGVLWHDDSQVATLDVATIIGAQDEAAAVRVEVRELPPFSDVERVARGRRAIQDALKEPVAAVSEATA